MKKIKGILTGILAAIAAMTVLCTVVSADAAVSFGGEITFNDNSAGSCTMPDGDFGQDGLMEALPEEVRESFENEGITPDDLGNSSLSPASAMNKLWDWICEMASQPLQMLAALFGVIILSAVIHVLKDGAGGSGLNEVFDTVGVLAGSGLICGWAGSILEQVKSTVEGMAAFMLTYVPTFAGVMAVNGQAGTAAAYSSVIITASEFFSQLTASVLFPLTSCVLGVSIGAAIYPDLHMDSLARGAKKLVTWALGLMMTIFTGLLSVQSFIASSSDSLALRTAKFTVSSSVPIIGGSVADALGTVSGSLSLIKSSMGGFGLIAVGGIVFPCLIGNICFRLAFTFAAAASDLFGTGRLTGLLKCGESVMDMVIAMLVSFGLLAVISTALMLALGNGG